MILARRNERRIDTAESGSPLLQSRVRLGFQLLTFLALKTAISLPLLIWYLFLTLEQNILHSIHSPTMEPSMTPSFTDSPSTFDVAPSFGRTMSGGILPTPAPQVPPSTSFKFFPSMIFGDSIFEGRNDDMPVLEEDHRPPTPFTLPPALLDDSSAKQPKSASTHTINSLTPGLLVAVIVLFTCLRWM